jgi:long-subunit fatty acid transport protein
MMRTLGVVGLLCTPLSAFSMGNAPISGALVSKTLGGTGVAHLADESDAILLNPAMLTQSSTEVGTHKVGLGVNTLLIDLQTTTAGKDPSYVRSKGKQYFMPSFAYFYNISDNLKFGVGLYQISGAASDYSDSDALDKDKKSYSFMTMPVSVGYRLNEANSFGLSLNLMQASIAVNNGGVVGDEEKKQNKMAFSPAVGYAFQLPGGHTLGAHYRRGAKVNFAEVADITFSGKYNDIEIGTPDQYAVGIGCKMNDLALTFDYKYVAWGQTANFKDLGWKNQSVLALGGQLRSGMLSYRGGFTYATRTVPVESNVDGDKLVPYQGLDVPTGVIQTMNANSGILRTAITAGLGIEASSAFTVNAGVAYYLPEQNTQSGTSTTTSGPYEIKEKFQETEIILMASYQVTP